MVIKPSPFTPLSALRFGQIAQSVLPAGVLSVVSGGNELGPQLTGHPDIAKISFTGSTDTGKHVLRSAAGTIKRVSLELGGNDAPIVLPDADYKALIPQLFGGQSATRVNGVSASSVSMSTVPSTRNLSRRLSTTRSSKSSAMASIRRSLSDRHRTRCNSIRSRPSSTTSKRTVRRSSLGATSTRGSRATSFR